MYSLATPPVYAYHRDQQVVAGESCAAGSGSISSIAFYGTGAYPTSYRDAFFFSDVARNCIWVMPKGSNGLRIRRGDRPSWQTRRTRST